MAAASARPQLELRPAREELAEVAEQEAPRTRSFVEVLFGDERQLLLAAHAQEHLIGALALRALARLLLFCAPTSLPHGATSLRPVTGTNGHADAEESRA